MRRWASALGRVCLGASLAACTLIKSLDRYGGAIDEADGSDAALVDGPVEGPTDAAPLGPVILAEGIDVRGLAANAQLAAWIVERRLFAVQAAAIVPIEIYESKTSDLSGGLSVRGVTVSFTDEQSVKSCRGTEPCAAPKDVITGLDDPWLLADLGDVHALHAPRRDAESPLELVRCKSADIPCAGGKAMQRWESNARGAWLVAAGKSPLGGDNLIMGTFGHEIWLIPPNANVTNGLAGAVLAKARGLTGVTADGSDVFWADGVDGRIMRKPLAPPTDGGSASDDVVVEARPSPAHVVASGDHLYWDERGELIKRCLKTDCAGTVVEVGRVPGVSHLAVGDRVYVASKSEQRLYALPL